MVLPAIIGGRHRSGIRWPAVLNTGGSRSLDRFPNMVGVEPMPVDEDALRGLQYIAEIDRLLASAPLAPIRRPHGKGKAFDNGAVQC